MAVILPAQPKDKDFEDLVAACLTSLGYFIETNLVLRAEKTEVLELDIVATPSDDRYLDRMLVEAKSGGWGLSDVFKLYGQMTYLGFARSEVVHRGGGDERSLKAAVEIGASCGITCREISIESLEKLKDDSGLPKVCVAMNEGLRGAVINASWYSRIADRIALAEFTRRCKSSAADPAFAAAKAYAQKVTESFFRKAPLARATALYAAYGESPRLSGALADAVAGKDGDKRAVMNAAINDVDHLVVQHALAIEQRARLRVVKNALDRGLQLAQSTGAPESAPKKPAFWAALMERTMPDGFQKGLATVAAHPYRNRLPFLYQAFVELFGGFYFNTDEDVGLIASVCGVPADQVLPALALLDQFFPFPGDGSWFYTGDDGIVLLKLVPGYLRGAGAYARSRMLGFDDYNVRYGRNGYWLVRWHNALYGVLKSYLENVPDEAPKPPAAAA